VLLSPDATQSDFLEDTAEAVYSRMDQVNPELRGDIDGWINAVEQEAHNRGELLPYTRAELFSKSFLRSLGYDVALPDYTVMPDGLLDAFKQELALDDGTNLIDGMEVLDQMAEPTESIEQSDVQRFARRIANNEDMSTPEDLQFYENNKEAIEQELTKISQEESPIGEDQFAITPETGYTDLEVAFNRLRRRNKPILKEGESLRNPKTFRKVVRRLERMTKKDLSALYDIDPDLSSIDLSPRKWYRADVDVTLSNTAEVHPEVYAQESYLLSLLGILSNGQPVATNYNQAGRVFGETENGKIPFTFYEKFHEKDGKWSRYDGLGKLQEGESPMGGVRGKKVAEQGKVLQQIIDKYGIENIDEFLLGSFTGHELKKMFPGTASHISNKADMNAKHYGAQVFGRKIGSYILNMHGIHEDAVLDVWMHRTFVRQTGGSKELKSNYNINEFRAHQEALKNVADDLAKTTGQPWGVDQVQALLWYNEKELYIQEGVKPEKGESYAKVSEKYAEVRGRRNVASSQDTGNTSSNEEGRNVDPRKSGQGAVSNDARAGNRRVDGRSSRANKRRGTGSTRSLRRLEPSEAPAFRRAISKAKTHNKFGSSVFIYSTAKYRGMKMFMSRNGAVGYAIKDDGDIVSVFHNKSIDSNSSALDALIPHAIENGGTKLDAFDTVLPRLYGKFGFVTTARDKWSDKYMPDGWDKKLYKKFNNGEPDVVYMELGVENPNTDLFSLKPTDKELADAFGGTPTKAELRASRRSERATKPKQLRDIIKSFSSQVNRINPMITQNVVKYQKAEADLLAEYMKPTTPFAQMLQKKKKKARTRRKKAEYMRLKLALLNSDSATIESILKGRDLKKYQAWRDAHDRMHDKAHAVGIDLGYIETHFPRQIINYDAFLQHVAGITSSGKTSKLLEAIRDAEAQIGRALTKEEKVGIANYLMRDQKGLIGQQHSDWSKNRKIDQVELEHARFYADPHIALQGYATGMSQQIARAQWLGGRPNRYTVRRFPKNADVNGVGIFDNKVGEFLRKDDNSLRVYRSRKDPGVSKILEVLRKEEQRRTGLSYMSIEDQVGGMLVKLQADHGGLTRGEEGRLRSLFVDYFKKGVMPTTANVMRNVGYITTMGSVFSAVTQLADLGVAVYRQGQGKFLGYLRPGTYASILKEMVASTVRLNKYKLKNLGLDQTILRELNDQHSPLERMMSFVFKATGLKAMDMIGKETYVNTAMKKYVKQAKMLQKGKNNKHTRMLLARLKRKFPQNEVDAIINDLATGKITELTELLAYSELLDIQPVADSELPIGYLRYNDGRRLFYMLKTFALKRLDVFVNEAQVLKKEAELLESQGKKVKAKQKRVQSMYHFMVLGTILAMAEAGADTIKDWMAGRKTPLDELVVSNMLKMFLISRYHYYNFINSKPSEAIIKMLMMPVDYIDDPARDVMYLAKRMDKYKNSRTASKYAWRDFKKRGAKSLRHFPILGKHLYWMDNDSEWKDVIDQYAPFIATGYGKRVMKERQKREQNK
jgi:hypothetical protein